MLLYGAHRLHVRHALDLLGKNTSENHSQTSIRQQLGRYRVARGGPARRRPTRGGKTSSGQMVDYTNANARRRPTASQPTAWLQVAAAD